MRHTIQIPTASWVIAELEAARREVGIKFTADLVREALDIPSPKDPPPDEQERERFRRRFLDAWASQNPAG